ncbi:hypothetical protein AMIS_58900 [Actinoplanes missouriensis 431]|uniref:Uncharacterized protein n=1 Tax=Actinoplanes missouriensis (strain ATCC 14538 / DSM 43046 / CBS 188.64 / JCM 3121 / NBRC 102363 / NCIMB 12654 / NRRL B-3342 / UNCC 431) TaxID=512565 RepID=I0HDM3_ACTM4|nr:hypothetical protein [Actinoplanes missouriensis]BAL91110.1 hypothetical protein AMIS_58900 [Actinoplanes missouriensis 431]
MTSAGIYDVYLIDSLDLDRLHAAMCEIAGVSGDDVDIDAEWHEGRNSDAAALCTYEPFDGDLTYYLDFYMRTVELSEADFAQRLSAHLRTPVVYAAESYPPSAFWLVEPDGQRLRVRLDGREEGETWLHLIEAVERPVGLLPHVPVEAQPEVIREHRMPTPVADGLRPSAGPEKVTRKAVSGLAAWEAMVVRMTSGWPPDGWYPLEYWQEDLATRDELAADLAKLSPDLAETVAAAVTMVDDTFRAATQEIPGVSADKAWWWHRAPEPPPWLNR